MTILKIFQSGLHQEHIKLLSERVDPARRPNRSQNLTFVDNDGNPYFLLSEPYQYDVNLLEYYKSADEQQRLDILVQVAWEIADLHRRGFAHGNLSLRTVRVAIGADGSKQVYFPGKNTFVNINDTNKGDAYPLQSGFYIDLKSLKSFEYGTRRFLWKADWSALATIMYAMIIEEMPYSDGYTREVFFKQFKSLLGKTTFGSVRSELKRDFEYLRVHEDFIDLIAELWTTDSFMIGGYTLQRRLNEYGLSSRRPVRPTTKDTIQAMLCQGANLNCVRADGDCLPASIAGAFSEHDGDFDQSAIRSLIHEKLTFILDVIGSSDNQEQLTILWTVF